MVLSGLVKTMGPFSVSDMGSQMRVRSSWRGQMKMVRGATGAVGNTVRV